ncbi:hypothetical protein BASA81_006883 [Batrachochytrium salamandrivorans]|nr:hypothetical protein BASA81_006883 [Batrachochytrium salamandrivorans]
MIRQDAFDEQGGGDDGWEILERFAPTPYDAPRNLPKFSRASPFSSSSTAAAAAALNESVDEVLPRRAVGTSSPSSSFNTITHQGFVYVLMLDEDEYVWEERFAICQPSKGLFVFHDEDEASSWKTSSPSLLYDQQHLLVNSFAGVDSMNKSLDGRLALELLGDGKKTKKPTLLASLAFDSAQDREEWRVAVHNASILAKFLLFANGNPNPDLVKMCLKERVAISSLVFKGSHVPFESICQLIEACGDKLVSLILDDCVVGEHGLSQLPILPASLQELDLGNNCGLGDAQMYQFLDKHLLMGLRSLSVANCGLGDVAMKRLAVFVRNSESMIGRLDVSCNVLVSVLGAYDLAVAALEKLESIDFSNCVELQDEFCQVLVLVLNKRIKHLGLANIGMTDVGMQRLLTKNISQRLVHCTVDFRNNHQLSLSICLQAVETQQTNRYLFSLLDEEEEALLQLVVNDVEEEENELPFDSTCMVTCFPFGPLPSYERLFRFLRGELGGREIKLFQSKLGNEFELIIPGDFNTDGVKQLQTNLHFNKLKYAVFRIEKVELLPSLTNDKVLSISSPPPSIHFLSNPTVSLQALANAVYDLFLYQGKSSGQMEIVQFQWEGLKNLSPTLIQAMQQLVIGVEPCKSSIIAAASGVLFEEVDGEYDALSWLQLGALLGDNKLIHQVFLKLKSSDSFCKRLGKITSTRFPPLLSTSLNETDFVLLSDELIATKVNQLFCESNLDVFCIQASELLGRVLHHPLSLHDLHIVMMFRTCMEEIPASQLEWMFALTALRLCPPVGVGLQSTLRRRYQQRYQETGQEMAQVCCRTLLYLSTSMVTLISPSVKQRLLFVKQCFKQRTAQITVYLPDQSGVLVDCNAYSTFGLMLTLINTKLMGREESLHRWRGFGFVSKIGNEMQLLRFEDDPFWWAQRTASRQAKLYLIHLVPSFSVMQIDLVDQFRVLQLFQQERRNYYLALSSSLIGLGVEMTSYLLVLLAIESLGEETFRYETSSSGLWQYIQTHFSRLSVNAACVERYRVEFLASKQLGNKLVVQSAFLFLNKQGGQKKRFHGVIPEHICESGVLMDATALQNLTLVIELDSNWGIGVYFETNAVEALIEFPFESLRLVQLQDGKWVKLVGEEGNWMSIEFPSEWEAMWFVDLLHLHLWALLAHGGLVTYEYLDLMDEEFAYRFPSFPKPPSLATTVLTASGKRHKHLSSKVKQMRFHAQILVDQLFREFGRVATPLLCTYAPLETTVFSTQNSSGEEEDLDDVEPPLTLPPMLMGEEEDGCTDDDEDVIPLPPNSPPPVDEEEEEEEEFDLSTIAPPVGPPPALIPMASPIIVAPSSSLPRGEHIAVADAPPTWLSANDLQQPPSKPTTTVKPLSMMEEMRLKQQQKRGFQEMVEETPPPPKRLSGNNNALLESMLKQRSPEAAAVEAPEAAAVEAPVAAVFVVQPPQDEQDPNAKRKAEFLRKKREREAAEAAAAAAAASG